MDEKWNVILYRSPSGVHPVQQFLDSLEIKAQAKVQDVIELLREFGIHLGSPHVKKLTGTNLWELHIIGGDSIRVLYVAVAGRTFVLLHGFKKKKDKTSPKDIKIAEDRLVEYRARTKLKT